MPPEVKDPFDFIFSQNTKQQQNTPQLFPKHVCHYALHKHPDSWSPCM